MTNLFITKLKTLSTITILITAFSESLIAGVILNNASDSDYTDLASEYDSVAELIADGMQGSAVKISDNWAITAAHLVEGKRNVNLSFDGKTTYNATDIIVHDNWAGDSTEGFDIALLKFDAGLGNFSAASLWDDGSVIGSVGTNVGFGKTGDGSSGANGSAGTKRAGNNVIDFVGTDIRAGLDPASMSFTTWAENILIQDFDNPEDQDSNFAGHSLWGISSDRSSSAEAIALEYLIASGDSGGGLFVDGNLVAINSFVASKSLGSSDSKYSDIAASTGLDRHKDWIYSTTGISPEAVVPEPSSFALLGLGLAGIAFWRQRRV